MCFMQEHYLVKMHLSMYQYHLENTPYILWLRKSRPTSLWATAETKMNLTRYLEKLIQERTGRRHERSCETQRRALSTLLSSNLQAETISVPKTQ